MSKYGIDVCSYQGKIDWGKVKKAGCKFAVLKCIRKNLTPDTSFRRNVQGCTAQKIPVSVYTYVYENTVWGAVKRAWAAIKACQSVGMEKCMIWWDVEDRNVFKAKNREKNTESIIAARAEVEKAGYSFGVYCDADFYTGMLNADKICGMWWIAAYHGNPVTAFGQAPRYKKPTIHNELCGWQYCSRGRVPGISGSVDLDIAYDDDFTSLTAKTTVKAPENVQSGADGEEKNLATLRKGDTGTQVKALQKLLRIVDVDGEFGEITELAVKSLQRSHNIKDDGVVGHKTWPFVIGG